MKVGGWTTEDYINVNIIYYFISLFILQVIHTYYIPFYNKVN